MKLGEGEGEGESGQVHGPGSVGKMRNTLKVWVDHRQQEEGAARVHSSSDPFGQNS